MSERYSDEDYERRDGLVEYLAIDTAGRSEPEIARLMEKHISRDEIIRYKEVKISEDGKEEIIIHQRNQDERVAYIVQSTLIALEVTPNTPDLFDNIDSWGIDPNQRINAEHALEVEKAVKAARKTLADAQARLSKVEFGEFMLDLLDEVQRHKGDTDLFRAFQILRGFSIDSSDLVPAHRTALVMLHQTI